MTETVDTTAPVTTGLYIGGEERRPPRRWRSRTRASPASSSAMPRRRAGRRRRRRRRGEGRLPGLVGAVRARSGRRRWPPRIEGIADDRDEDAAILSQENGKIRPRGLGRFAGLRDPLEARARPSPTRSRRPRCCRRLPASRSQTTVAYQPLGVVTVIVPFNWPIAILAAALPHALLAGNTAIVKPPPSTPLATTRLVQRVAEKLPPGVLNVVTGRDARWPA